MQYARSHMELKIKPSTVMQKESEKYTETKTAEQTTDSHSQHISKQQ